LPGLRKLRAGGEKSAPLWYGKIPVTGCRLRLSAGFLLARAHCGRGHMPRRSSDAGEPIIQKRRVYHVVRKQRGKRYTYPRLTLEGGGLDAMGLRVGQTVIVEHHKGEILVRPSQVCADPDCGRSAIKKGYCSIHYTPPRRASVRGAGSAAKRRRR